MDKIVLTVIEDKKPNVYNVAAMRTTMGQIEIGGPLEVFDLVKRKFCDKNIVRVTNINGTHVFLSLLALKTTLVSGFDFMLLDTGNPFTDSKGTLRSEISDFFLEELGISEDELPKGMYDEIFNGIVLEFNKVRRIVELVERVCMNKHITPVLGKCPDDFIHKLKINDFSYGTKIGCEYSR